ncbi:hypothetical protein JOQ06_019211 [Pogonophryne albipinna]|uniref:Uncharacterized protein n=1 Tax=Pogonophryne albipinna TaxID=1090488 RepID=A0AAD6AU15_9TELE|nr:hypothetical protein JOQ06_019211 [Pogonophryne albipinna]
MDLLTIFCYLLLLCFEPSAASSLITADIFEARGRRQTSLTTTVLNYERLLHLDPSLYNKTPKETSFQMDFTKHFFNQHSIRKY